MEEITVKQLLEMDGRDYLVVDIRDSIAFAYGSINGAVNVPADEVENYSDFPTDKLLVICCKSGVISDSVAERLRERGFNAANLKEGYYGYMLSSLKTDEQGQRMSSAV